MKDLDQNKDDKLDFEEFIPLVVGLSMACEKCFMLHEKKGKKWCTNDVKKWWFHFFFYDKENFVALMCQTCK